MMVIRGTIGTDANHYYPADRCFWTDSYDGSNYSISGAFYVPGVETSIGGVGPATTFSLGSDAQLGMIGKSGRFVGFTV